MPTSGYFYYFSRTAMDKASPLKEADNLPGFRPVYTCLADLKFSPPDDLLTRVSYQIEPVSIKHIASTEATAAHIVDAWDALLGNIAAKNELPLADEVARIFLLLFFHYSFDRKNEKSHLLDAELRRRLTPQGRPMNLGGTWFEATRRLAGRLYNLGRRGAVNEHSKALLERAVKLFDFLLARDKRASDPRAKSLYLGMRGVANFFLARLDDSPIPRFEAAYQDLEESGDLGNRSLEHDQYLTDCYLHLYDLTSKIELLDKAEALLAELNDKYPETRKLCFTMGESDLRRGFILANESKIAEALPFFQSAADKFSRALDLPEQPSILDDQIDYIRMKRGHARLRLYTSRHVSEGAEDEEILNLAIEDLTFGGTSLPAALILRSILLRKRKEFHLALRDLEQALPLCSEESLRAEPASNYGRVLAGIGECKVWIGIDAGDSKKVNDGCEALLNVPSSVREVNTAALFYGAKYLLSRQPTSEVQGLIERIVGEIEARLILYDPEGDSRRFNASHAAGLLFSIAGEYPELSLLERVYRLYCIAISASNEPGDAELYGHAGGTALKTAKLNLRKGDRDGALGYLEDASELFLRALEQANSGLHSEFFSQPTAHSKLGETYVRLNALTGQKEYADKAIYHLQTSRSLGNEAPELLGLIGDAYYRRGRALRSREDLQEAVMLKQASKAMGLASRENGSVRAAANIRLWEITNDTKYLGTAIESACDAIEADETWPWPFFQMAELASLPEPVRREAAQPLEGRWKDRELIKQIQLGHSRQLYQKGCDLAINNKEFDKDEFKSRQLVYVLDDPHRLLKQSFVFKHTPRENAEREVDTLRGFRRFLTSSGTPTYFELPEPILTLPLDKNEVVYMMRRAQGVQLGQLVIEWMKGRSIRPTEAYRRTLHYLAYFHGWGIQMRGGIQETRQKTIKELAEGTVKLWRALGINPDELIELKQKLADIVPNGLPALLKKDAHPENWLVTSKEHIVMLDLEATASRPLFFEAAQLIEDYPLFKNDESEWQQRLQLCETYGQTLRDLGVAFDTSQLSIAYAAFALFRASFGWARIILRKRSGKIAESSSALRASDIRENHYLSLIKFLAEHGETAELRQCGELLLSKTEAVATVSG